MSDGGLDNDEGFGYTILRGERRLNLIFLCPERRDEFEEPEDPARS